MKTFFKRLHKAVRTNWWFINRVPILIIIIGILLMIFTLACVSVLIESI